MNELCNKKKNNYAVLYHDLTVLNSVVCHHGVKGQEWYKHKADRWQNHAKYAMGKSKFAEVAKGREAADEREQKSPLQKFKESIPHREGQQWRQNGSAKDFVKGILNKLAIPKRERLSTITKGVPGLSIYKFGNDKGLKNRTIEVFKAVKDYVISDKPIENVVHALRRAGADNYASQTLAIGPLAVRLESPVRLMSDWGVLGTRISNTVIGAGLTVADRRSAVRDPKTGLGLKTSKHHNSTEIEDDALLCNPFYGSVSARMNVNALSCITAMEMRRRGYAVMSKRRFFERYDQGNEQKITQQFKGAKIKPIKDGPSIKTTLKEQPEGSRGVVFFNWKFTQTSGHCFYYQVQNGKVIVSDPQSGKTWYNLNALDKLFDRSSLPSYARLDTAKAVMEYIKEAVE